MTTLNPDPINTATGSFPELNNLPLQYDTDSSSPSANPNFHPKDKVNQKVKTITASSLSASEVIKKPSLKSPERILKESDILIKPWYKSSKMGTALVIITFVAIYLTTSKMLGTGTNLPFFVALIPYAVILLIVLWIQKWSLDSKKIRRIAIIWGVVGSILLTLGVTLLSNLTLGEIEDSFTMVAIQAPIVEEFSKGILILVIALIWGKRFTSPIDGVVYMTLIASGFAFTENVLYFSGAYNNGGGVALFFIFFLRGVLSPFAHVLFSLPMGIIIGIAASRRMKKRYIILLGIAIYPLSVFLHGLWNGSSMVVQDTSSWYVFYALIEFPLFIAAIALVSWLRKKELYKLLKHMTEYAHQGWFTQPEVETFATVAGRKRIKLWSKTKGPQCSTLVKTIMEDTLLLSHVRFLIIKTKNETKRATLSLEEEQLLKKLVINKTSLTTLF